MKHVSERYFLPSCMSQQHGKRYFPVSRPTRWSLSYLDFYRMSPILDSHIISYHISHFKCFFRGIYIRSVQLKMRLNFQKVESPSEMSNGLRLLNKKIKYKNISPLQWIGRGLKSVFFVLKYWLNISWRTSCRTFKCISISEKLTFHTFSRQYTFQKNAGQHFQKNIYVPVSGVENVEKQTHQKKAFSIPTPNSNRQMQ